MSQENVDFVREGYARFNAGERTAELWFWHPDGEYQAAREDPDSATHQGIDAIRKQFARWFDAYPDLRVEPLEARSNDDRVFLWVRFVGHPNRSAISAQCCGLITSNTSGRSRFTGAASAVPCASQDTHSPVVIMKAAFRPKDCCTYAGIREDTPQFKAKKEPPLLKGG